MKRTYIAAALMAWAAAPAMAADYYYYPAPTMTVVTTAGYVYQDPDTIRAVQYRLLDRGYTVPIDGVFDSYTVEALKHWQQLQGFEPTGVINQTTLTVLDIRKGMPATIRRD